MKSVNTYVNFDGNCRQAVSFYQQCLGAELQIMPFADSNGQPSTDPNAKVMHAHLGKGGITILMASDCPPGMPLEKGNNYTINIDCESLEEIEGLFQALSQGGQVKMPLGDMFWGARFGMLTDRFGVQWMFNCQLEKKEGA